MLRIALLTLLWITPVAGFAQVQPVPFESGDPRSGFQILVWQYKTEAQRDVDLYRSVNLNAWHIDRGDGQETRRRWAVDQQMPYYVDHAAGKGILHLTPRSGLDDIARDGSPSPRPWSFFDPATMVELKARLDRNVPPVADGPVVAIALDDEVSLGTFNSPLEVDFSPAAFAEFRKWLPSRYASTRDLRAAWNSSDVGSVVPVPYERVRGQIAQPTSEWRLAPWLDFRAFMDGAQADTFRSLVEYTNRLAPNVPVGVVGGQQPSAYGGFDYSKLRDAVQFLESYDIGGTNEILHSMWSDVPRQPRMQTYFASGDLKADEWFLWYYMAHGCRGVIAWPDLRGNAWFDGKQVHPHIQKLTGTFAAVQSDEMAALSDPMTKPLFDPIAVLYSHPSAQVGWAVDASTHGKTWPRRSSSLDNSSLSSGKNRVAWTRLLEDIGYQAKIIDTKELVDGALQNDSFRVLILPQTFALSRDECAAIRKFVRAGGSVIADYGTACVDEHGTGYERSPLDAVFGIDRSAGSDWFDRRRFEIDGERYKSPLVERLTASPISDDGQLAPIESSVTKTHVENRLGNGTTLFMNASPTAYYSKDMRAGDFGDLWRTTISNFLKDRGIEPVVKLRAASGHDYGLEVLRYRTADDRELWVIVENPTRQASVDGPGSRIDLLDEPVEIELVSERQVTLKTMSGKVVTRGKTMFEPATAVVFEAVRGD